MTQKKNTLHNILVKSALSGLKLQRKDGSFCPGHNGPWNDLDTPARVTAHWCLTFIKAYELTKDSRFKRAAKKAGIYLTSKKCRPYGFSFFCRNTKNKCNGLIGQAWVIEALIRLGSFLKDGKYFEIAEDVILKHAFNENLCLWHNLEIDGRRLNLNRTLNQQIWFGAMAYKLACIINNETIMSKAVSFFKNLHKHMRFNGKHITHLIHPLANFIFKKEAIGYLSFSIAGLSHAYKLNPSLINKQVIDYVSKSNEFLNRKIYQSDSKFCWSYNPTGFEAAYAIKTFKLRSSRTSSEWISKQLAKHFDFQSNLMNKNTPDPDTLAARIYEAACLPNITV